MVEWKEVRKISSVGEFEVVNWQLHGELTLDLRLAGGVGEITDFELARFLCHPSHVTSMVKDPLEAARALERIRTTGNYTDIVWIGYSPEQLRKYFKEHRLPLPPNYKEEFTRVDSIRIDSIRNRTT